MICLIRRIAGQHQLAADDRCGYAGGAAALIFSTIPSVEQPKSSRSPAASVMIVTPLIVKEPPLVRPGASGR